MAKTPPDFNALFFSSLGGEPAAISLTLRHGPNLLHDLTFMTGLLHDARVLNRNGQPNNGMLAIRFNRDCWELGQVETASRSLRMHATDSVLTCSGVVAAAWNGDGIKQSILSLNHLWISRDYFDHRATTFMLSLLGDNWTCAITLERDNWTVTLQDEAVPRLR